MKTVSVPLVSRVHRSVDKKELTDHNQRVVDAYNDEMGFHVSRPGLGSFHDLSLGTKGVDGIYWWSEQECAVVICNGNAYRLDYDGTTVTETNLTDASFLPDRVPSFASNGDNLVIATGGSMVHTNGTASSTSFFTDNDAPSMVGDVGYLDGYIIAIEGNFFFWSKVGVSNFENWPSLNFAQAVGSPDDIRAMRIFDRQIFLFGDRSVEIWQNDGTNPFSRIPGGFVEVGIEAPKSVIRDNRQFYFLAKDEGSVFFARFSGGGYQRLTSPYDKDIQEMSVKSDCRADKLWIDGKPFIAFHFPAADKTYVYNIALEDWTEFGYWRPGAFAYERWRGTCAAYCPKWGITLVGDRKKSLIYVMSRDYEDDNGEDIRTSRITGNINHGTFNSKKSRRLTMLAKRGHTSGSSEPKAFLRMYDDGSEDAYEVPVSLGKKGDYNMFVEARQLGIYQSRRYELYSTEPLKLVMGNPQEEVEVLNR